MEIEGKSFIEINEEDAARLGIENGELVRASSRPGLHRDNRPGGYEGISGRNLDAVPLP